MTANILNAELANIIQDAKKRNTELRSAAEQSLQDLKAITVTSEAQLAADLRRKARFVTPFLLACKTKSAKSTLSAVSCLQRLVVNNGLPKDRLQEVLEAFQESVPIGLDAQLRILQALPSFLQNYGDELEGEMQARVLQTCIALQQIKNAAVSNTASATLQQSVSSLFEKVETEDSSREQQAPVEEVQTDQGLVSVRRAAYDAYRVLKDVCLMTQGQEPQYIRKASLPQAFGLELIETILLNHADVLHNHPEFADLLLKYVMPLVNQLLSERLGFPLTVRTIRILCILVREHLDTVETECEIALGLLNHTLESESTQPWRRALCIEAFRVIYSNAELVVDVFSAFDHQKERGNVVQDNLSLFVRMASEKPALIGLGQQSSMPSAAAANKSGGQEQAVAEAEAAVGMFGSDFGVTENNVPGISSQWSSMKVPCLDQLDKAEGPQIPETYVYSLILGCVNGLSDSLAKVVLPLSMHRSQRKHRSPSRTTERDNTVDQHRPSTGDGAVETSVPREKPSRVIPANPLDLSDRDGQSGAAAVAELITSCWPAVLATASTFFNASLDADHYRSLVRSFQKFTQVAGILRLSTPRDALLTTLAKFAVPPSLLSDITSATPVSPNGGSHRSFKNLLSPTNDGPTESTQKSRQSSAENSPPTLTQRNLMCLRALTHLAIALGPILDQAWPIILETLQKANVLMATSGVAAMARDYRSNTQAGSESNQSQPTLASEMSAVESAVGKLLQTTSEYPIDSFVVLLTAFCNILASSRPPVPAVAPPMSPTSSQRRMPSVSGIASTAALRPQYSHFAIAKLGDLAKVNLRRLACGDRNDGWDLLLMHLKDAATDTYGDSAAKQMAADVVASVAAEASISTASESEQLRREVQQRSLNALKTIIEPLHTTYHKAISEANLDIHQSALGSLRAILEHCGEAVITGWDEIFDIVDSVFNRKLISGATDTAVDDDDVITAKPLSAKLARSGFACLQLICSDFLGVLSANSYPVLIDILTKFCAQTIDMNISLSITTVFWNVSDHLRTEIEAFDLPSDTLKDITVSSQLRTFALGGSVTATWLMLQQRLALLTQDTRGDVRNGSVHILFRTLESSGSRLTPVVWQLVLRTVLFRLLKIDTEKQSHIHDQDPPAAATERKAMNQSSGLIIESTAKVFTNFINPLATLPASEENWHLLLESFAAYIDCESYALVEDVFTALARILAAVKDLSVLTPQAINEVASLWAREIPKGSELPENDASSRDKALLAYLQTLKQVHRLWKENIKEKQIKVVIQRLQECVYTSRATPYVVDITRETDLQVEVTSCFNMLQMHLEAVPSSIIEALADFAQLPCKTNGSSPAPQTLTFVAFAKTSMDLLLDSVTKLASNLTIYTEGGLVSSLRALALCVERKYTWKVQGPEVSLWRKAAVSAVSILETVIPNIDQLGLDQTQIQSIWLSIVRVGAAFQSAEYVDQPADGILLPDETYDLDLSSRFRLLVTPHLESGVIADEVRLAHVYSLFRTSIIHPSKHDDEGYSNGETGKSTPSLSLLRAIRLGRTHDPTFVPRIRIAYAALDELYSLISSPRESVHSEAGQLARVAFPFAIVRAAIPIKRYIADQPLRGRMPIPNSHRLELLHILRTIAELDCLSNVADGVPASGDVTMPSAGKGKEHLRWLAPLVHQAMECVGGDLGVNKAMGKVLSVIVSA